MINPLQDATESNPIHPIFYEPFADSIECYWFYLIQQISVIWDWLTACRLNGLWTFWPSACLEGAQKLVISVAGAACCREVRSIDILWKRSVDSVESSRHCCMAFHRRPRRSP